MDPAVLFVIWLCGFCAICCWLAMSFRPRQGDYSNPFSDGENYSDDDDDDSPFNYGSIVTFGEY